MADVGERTGRWWAILVGLAWSQAGAALRLFVIPRLITLGDGVVDGWWYRLASWTLLAPLTSATRLVDVAVKALQWDMVPDGSLPALLLCPLFGMTMCIVAARVLRSPRWHRQTVACVTAVGLLGAVCGVAVALQFRDAYLAERTFFAMVSRVDVAHKDAATVSAAREFANRHPDSRWAGEALRIVAMAEWDAGNVEASSRLWSRFESRFRDQTVPGVAYAEYSIALCDERLGRQSEAQRHLRAAIEVIRARGDGVQAWIATDAAVRLAEHARSEGRYALAGYWETKSRTFSDVYSIE